MATKEIIQQKFTVFLLYKVYSVSPSQSLHSVNFSRSCDNNNMIKTMYFTYCNKKKMEIIQWVGFGLFDIMRNTYKGAWRLYSQVKNLWLFTFPIIFILFLSLSFLFSSRTHSKVNTTSYFHRTVTQQQPTDIQSKKCPLFGKCMAAPISHHPSKGIKWVY